jgi:hypothetical protein
MLSKIREWLNGPNAIKSLLVKFASYYLMWMLLTILFQKIIWDEPKPLTYFVIYPILQASTFTIIFNWKQFKSLFKKSQNP